jgi:hypothetical protein
MRRFIGGASKGLSRLCERQYVAISLRRLEFGIASGEGATPGPRGAIFDNSSIASCLTRSPNSLCKSLRASRFGGFPRFSQRFPRLFPQILCKEKFTRAYDSRRVLCEIDNCRRCATQSARIGDPSDPGSDRLRKARWIKRGSLAALIGTCRGEGPCSGD